VAHLRIELPEDIYTSNPEQEIWNFVGDLESEHFCFDFIRERIKRNYSWKRANQIFKKKKSLKDVELFRPIRTKDIKKIISEITNNAKQATDFYMSSKSLPLLSKPVLLYYAFEKLANILSLVTFSEPYSKFAHGLSYHKGQPINIHRKGLFQIFHDCYSDDPSIYLENHNFKLENIISAGETNYVRLQSLMIEDNKANKLYSEAKSEIKIDELDREFIFIFALSTLARYRVNDWAEIISGKRSNLIVKIRRYLQSVELLFPNLVLNELHEKILMFYEPARMGGDI
jgi:hypothetical protein